MLKRSFYQDRLRTNVGKTPKSGRFVQDCQCVQATHYCTKAPVTCADSCNEAGKPSPKDYCIKGQPLPPPGPPSVPTTSMVGVAGDCNQPTT